MIHVEVYRHGDEIQGFSVSGHAGYAEYGQDIVCSAVSALTESTANGITEIAHLPFEVTDDEDTVCCMKKGELNESQKHDAKILLETFVLSVDRIRKAYGQYLKISNRRI